MTDSSCFTVVSVVGGSCVGKPAAVSLLAGSANKIALFPDDLAYGAGSTSGVKRTRWAQQRYTGEVEEDGPQ
jgi:hypothetical protein